MLSGAGYFRRCWRLHRPSGLGENWLFVIFNSILARENNAVIEVDYLRFGYDKMAGD